MQKQDKFLIKIFKNIDKINNLSDLNLENKSALRGRKIVCSENTQLKLFIIMKLLNIKTIQSLADYLNSNPKIARACNLENGIDRSTLNRHLSSKIKNWL